MLFDAARSKLGADEFAKMLGGVAGIEDLLGAAPVSAGSGKVLGGLAQRLGGGNVALFARVMGGFSKLGLNPEQAKRFVPLMVEYLRARIGPDAVAQLERTLRA